MKYKLIKDFPMCPIEIGGEVVLDERGQYVSEEVIIFEKEIIENYPEFWQKVEVLDYQILSFQDISNKNIITFRENRNVFMIENAGDSEFKGSSLKQEMKLVYIGRYVIHSVKRLSDGEVFTIGDIIANMCDSEQKISELYINKHDGKMCVYTSTTCRFTIDNIKKVKSPLFTTEDGVDIFNKTQKVFSVSECDFLLQSHQDFAWIKTRNTDRKYHHFSTKEKAEEYIINNKPCLSIVELQKWFSSYGIQLTGLETLKKIVKSKI